MSAHVTETETERDSARSRARSRSRAAIPDGFDAGLAVAVFLLVRARGARRRRTTRRRDPVHRRTGAAARVATTAPPARLPRPLRGRLRAVARPGRHRRRRRAADRALHGRRPRVPEEGPRRRRDPGARCDPRGELGRRLPRVRGVVGALRRGRRARYQRPPPPRAARLARGPGRSPRARARPAGPDRRCRRASPHRARDARHRGAQSHGHRGARGWRGVRVRANAREGDRGDGERVGHGAPGARRDAPPARRVAR